MRGEERREREREREREKERMKERKRRGEGPLGPTELGGDPRDI